MKKFRFQLDTLLKVTRMKKDDIEVKFAAAARKVEEEKQRLAQLEAELEQGQRDYDELQQEGKRISVGTLMTFNSFFAWKRQQIEAQNQVILAAKAEHQKCLKELMEVMSYLKSIEQLKDKRFKEYMAQALFEEQKMLDEIGLQLHMRRMQA